MNQTVIILVFAILLIGFMIFSSRRNRKRQATLRDAIVPGVEVMTNFGLFGKLLSVDEVTPSTGDAPRSVEEAMAIANREQAERDANAKVDSEAPAYGERVDDPITKATTKRAPRAAKKTDN
jgi:preprotein translocase subunit YajC